jgi:hypothetical protein
VLRLSVFLSTLSISHSNSNAFSFSVDMDDLPALDGDDENEESAMEQVD